MTDVEGRIGRDLEMTLRPDPGCLFGEAGGGGGGGCCSLTQLEAASEGTLG